MALHTLKNIRSITAPGMHGDGGGLYLKVTKSGTKSWIYRTPGVLKADISFLASLLRSKITPIIIIIAPIQLHI
jgi:hypothetical protein